MPKYIYRNIGECLYHIRQENLNTLEICNKIDIFSIYDFKLKKISSKDIFMACKIFANCIDFTIQKAHDGIFEF